MEYTGNLLELTTNLKSLKFEGSEPYVQKDIGESEKGLNLQVQRRLDDVQRVAKVLASSGGLKFITNQGLLNLLPNQNKELGSRLIQTVTNTGAITATVLGQTAVAGTGLYLSVTDLTGGKYLGRSPITDNLPKVSDIDNFEEVLPGSGDRFDSKLKSKESRFKRNINILGSTQEGFYTERSKNYLSNSKEIKLKLGKTKGRIGDNVPLDFIDRINYLDIQTQTLEELKLEDIIPFRISIFEPGKDTSYLFFRAYLDTFTDSYTGTWNGTNYVGRAEEIYNYTGFKRDIGFSFKIASTSDVELLPLYKKLNKLAGTTAPSYSSTFMRGVFTKVTVGDYLIDLPGFFSSVQLGWNTNYPWEIGKGRAGFRDTGGQEDPTFTSPPKVPHILDVTVTFTPIHNFNPEINSPYIMNQGFQDSKIQQPEYVVGSKTNTNTSEDIQNSNTGIEINIPEFNRPALRYL